MSTIITGSTTAISTSALPSFLAHKAERSRASNKPTFAGMPEKLLPDSGALRSLAPISNMSLDTFFIVTTPDIARL
jgi:hypothetical protein